MNILNPQITRREFLKFASTGTLAFALKDLRLDRALSADSITQGRMTISGLPLYDAPTFNANKLHNFNADEVVDITAVDEKGELGWDEFQAVKYLAWEHQLALIILASWFIAETRLDWMKRFERDPALLAQYEIEVLPLLSVSNVRELLRAAMPLPQLSIQEAATLVAKHLTNRTRSRKSRLRKRRESSFES